MIFGIWPGVIASDNVNFAPLDCAPEDPAATLAALRGLQGDAPGFYVRCYRHFGSAGAPDARTPRHPQRYLGEGRRIDLVACYQSLEPDPDGFGEFVREAVRDLDRWGGGKLQVGEELNMPAPLDGGMPESFTAVGRGLAAALEERERTAAEVAIGVNAAGMAAPEFWQRLAAAVGPKILAQLDYIGLDIFPDVFHPVPHEQLASAVSYVIERFRATTSEVGVPASTPIHITETGWPTDESRDETTQARVLDTVARAAADAGVTTYEFFGLRDGRSDAAWTSRFGILHDDYTPKPAYDAVCRLIAEYASQ